jgi:hypothetical protein
VTALTARLESWSFTSPRAVGVYGIVLGLLAFWLALPPLHTRTTVAPVVVGILAIAAGLWSFALGLMAA